jgi:hypothetical protein
MKAIFGSYELKGGIGLIPNGKSVAAACPSCGQASVLPSPPFSFDEKTLSVRPSIKFSCGWHGYLTGGEWKESPDSTCGKLAAAAASAEDVTVAKKKEALKVGQHVSFLRSHNKAVSLTGTVVKLYDDGSPVVDVKLDDHDPEWIETAHLDDVTVLEK